MLLADLKISQKKQYIRNGLICKQNGEAHKTDYYYLAGKRAHISIEI